MIENAEEILLKQRRRNRERQRKFLEEQKLKHGRKTRSILMTDEEYERVKELLTELREANDDCSTTT